MKNPRGKQTQADRSLGCKIWNRKAHAVANWNSQRFLGLQFYVSVKSRSKHSISGKPIFRIILLSRALGWGQKYKISYDSASQKTPRRNRRNKTAFMISWVHEYYKFSFNIRVVFVCARREQSRGPAVPNAQTSLSVWLAATEIEREIVWVS